jgi:RHS repeat-associated protein
MQGAGGIGGLLARTDNTRLAVGDSLASAYYHCDGNGNVTCLVTPYQQIAAKYLYDPYGNMLAMWGSLAAANVYRFSSKEWNGNSGLYYYLYRFYDPNLQRWPNHDPLGESGFEIVRSSNAFKISGHRPSLNGAYMFCDNEPIALRDAYGLASSDAEYQSCLNGCKDALRDRYRNTDTCAKYAFYGGGVVGGLGGGALGAGKGKGLTGLLLGTLLGPVDWATAELIGTVYSDAVYVACVTGCQAEHTPIDPTYNNFLP